ncbi:MAG: endonuclease/exonuclease/phosphatase family protein [Bacteroidales bacterium]|nr:endonuclease/exonuclease/phosphatase family protein [Bacteroidales bacterium]
MKAVFILVIATILFCGFAKFSMQGDYDFVVVSYNVENLFDTINNPATADDEFTPEGERHWDSFRYYQKLKKLWKVVAATTYDDFPDVIGLYEVENRDVVSDLLYKTPLWRGRYSIFHRESMDRRGIDVAIAYRAQTFRPLDSAAIRINFDGADSTYFTRDILYLKGLVKSSGDTLHIFANHWPSRYSGFSASEILRCRAATVLRACVDSIFAVEPCAKILCMGDFNDNPDNMSVNEYLKARTDLSNFSPGNLYNVSFPLWTDRHLWTYWYQGRGDFLDQIIASGSLLDGSGLHFGIDDAGPLQEAFVRNEDGSIFRTYMGPKYMGGYSDHLPVVIRMNYKGNER